ncbi:unnamed protein product [Somion occarium]
MMILEKGVLPPTPSVVDTKESEKPPPYTSPEPSSSSTQTPQLPPAVRANNSLFQSLVQQQVNHLYLHSRHNPISGSYILNSELPPLAIGCDRPKQCGRVPLDGQNKRLFKQPHTPNASFQTRHGAISLNLATAGSTEDITRTYVQTNSRHGKINVNLFALQLHKHICLEVATRHGHIVVFLPQCFQGAIQIRSRRGNVNFLPGFAQSARVVSGNDRFALVLFGINNLTLSDLDSDALDVCLLSTRHGKITIGISGVDTYDDSQSTNLLVKKLGSLSTMILGTDVTR